ncbi:MAG: SprT family zinc-dependent metalloprotease [Anaerolineales bacterium]
MTIPHVDQLIRSKRKTIAILVQRDGKVIVRAPLKASERQIRQFVESKTRWILEKKAQAQQQPSQTARQFTAGERFPYLGQEYALSVVSSAKTGLRFEGGFSLNQNSQAEAALLFEKWYKAAARKVLTERVRFYAHKFGLKYQKIRISSARTRWGSCSSRGTLSFTWRLVMAPLDVVDYVVIHELAHLREQNHSAAFWAEVAKMMPDYKTRRDWLKKNGRFLTLQDA